ncbi:hypothetical protein HHK36_026592 [Tetracentron sinense]|uniref:Serine/threonine-protein kinase ULK4/RUNKEL HEAT repeats domain-containing protein n=1 Tax=Tetracentron sinense TaxID=13715 RepID=A0A834YJY2_TETSI|nr:hypothetical protein HHK36_026592 [Tetracentron sinense]
MIGGRHHGQIASLSDRATLMITDQLFPVLHLLGSFSFKHWVVSHQVLQQLANLSELVQLPFQRLGVLALWYLWLTVAESASLHLKS